MMARLRGLAPTASAKLLTGGPGRLCQAFGITRATHHDMDVTGGASSILQILADGFRTKTIEIAPRIGIRNAADLPLRFLVGKTTSKLRTP